MSKAKRKQPYRTKREKLTHHVRNIKLILLFGLIALTFFVVTKWQDISDWLILTF